MKKKDQEKSLSRVANLSKKSLEFQIKSFYSTHTKAGILIGMNSLFIPLFLFLMKDPSGTILFLSTLTIFVFLASIFFMVKVLFSKSLYSGINSDKYSELINTSLQVILLKEIAVNKDSIDSNNNTILIQHKNYNIGLVLMFIATSAEILLLIINLFLK